MAVEFTTTINGKTFGFDFVDEQVEVDAGTDGVTAAEVKQACREAEWSFQGIVYDDIIETGLPVTLDPVNNVSTALNVIFLQLWRILSLKSSGGFVVQEGNTVRFDTGVDIFASNPLVDYSNIVSAAATQIISGSGVTNQDKIDIKDLVFAEIMEGAETFAEAIRIIRAEAAGDIVKTGTLHEIKSADGVKNRITANADEDGRDVTSVDGT